MVKFLKKLKQKFGRFQGQFYLEDQGQEFKELVKDLYVNNTWLKFEDKIQNTSKVIIFTRNHTDDATEPKTIHVCLPPVRGGGET